MRFPRFRLSRIRFAPAMPASARRARRLVPAALALIALAGFAAPASALPNAGAAPLAGLGAPAAEPAYWRAGVWVGPGGPRGVYVRRPIGRPYPAYRPPVRPVYVAAPPAVYVAGPVVVAAPRCVWRTRYVRTASGALVKRSVKICR